MSWMVAGLVASLVVGGCSSTPEAAGEQAAESKTFEASTASRSELGVVAWTATTTEGGHVITVRGVGADGTVAAHLDTRFSDAGGLARITQHFRLGGASAATELRTTPIEGAPGIEVESSLADAPSSVRRGLDLLFEDLAAAKPARAGLANSVRLASSAFAAETRLAPQDELVVKECGLTRSCSALDQALRCALTTKDLLACNPAGLLTTGAKKGGTWAAKMFPFAREIFENLPDCLDGVQKFPPDCMHQTTWGHDPMHATEIGRDVDCDHPDDNETCDDGACAAESGACSTNTDCCSGWQCLDGKCQKPTHDPEQCRGAGSFCGSSASGDGNTDCCEGLSCVRDANVMDKFVCR